MLSKEESSKLQAYCSARLKQLQNKEANTNVLTDVLKQKRMMREKILTELVESQAPAVKVNNANVYYKVKEAATSRKVTEEHLFALKEAVEGCEKSCATLTEWIDFLTNKIHNLRTSKKITLVKVTKRPRGFNPGALQTTTVQKAAELHKIEKTTEEKKGSTRLKISDTLTKTVQDILCRHQETFQIKMKDKTKIQTFTIQKKRRRIQARTTKKVIQNFTEESLSKVFPDEDANRNITRDELLTQFNQFHLNFMECLSTLTQHRDAITFSRCKTK